MSLHEFIFSHRFLQAVVLAETVARRDTSRASVHKVVAVRFCVTCFRFELQLQEVVTALATSASIAANLVISRANVRKNVSLLPAKVVSMQ